MAICPIFSKEGTGSQPKPEKLGDFEMITQKQEALIRRLLAEKDVPQDFLNDNPIRWTTDDGTDKAVTTKQASSIINQLFRMPNKTGDARICTDKQRDLIRRAWKESQQFFAENGIEHVSMNMNIKEASDLIGRILDWEKTNRPTEAGTPRSATPKQKAYLQRLIREDGPGTENQSRLANLDQLTAAEASALIDEYAS